MGDVIYPDTGTKYISKITLPDNATYEIKDSSAQEKLVSGTNIKTINNQSLLGSGNITIEGGSVEAMTDSEIETAVNTGWGADEIGREDIPGLDPGGDIDLGDDIIILDP